jgi:hypothetical protein
MNFFKKIAIFILGTTTPNSRFPQKYKTYYESRIVPIVTTWASYFPFVYFVFGTNRFDHKFLDKHCQLHETIPNYPISKLQPSHRTLIARTPQKIPQNIYELYSCPVIESNHTLPLKFNVLYIGNCTGEYFGIGPTCRCQETIRFFQQSLLLKDLPWFLFMDDDVYIRPYTLFSVLQTMTNHPQLSHHPVALLSSLSGRQATSIKPKKPTPTSITQRCQQLWYDSYYYAQPALLNNAALNILKKAIDNDGMIQLHQIWGGSHDSILGLLLWIYPQIKVYSFGRYYMGHVLPIHSLETTHFRRESIYHYFMFHRMLNFIQYTKNPIQEQQQQQQQYLPQYRYPSQWDIARVLHDFILYNMSNHWIPYVYQEVQVFNISLLSTITKQQIQQEQDYFGKQIVYSLLVLNRSQIEESKYFHRIGFQNSTRANDFSPFLPTDC